MLGFLIDNIYVVFGDQVFQQSVGIPMGINCAPLLADLLYPPQTKFGGGGVYRFHPVCPKYAVVRNSS